MATILEKCLKLRKAFEAGLLGDQTMPEDSHPTFNNLEEKLRYFSLPMSLNYQRNSYTLWQVALQAWEDPVTRQMFSPSVAAKLPPERLRELLLQYKVGLQPNKHTHTWQTISNTVASEWGSFAKLLEAANYDFLQLQELIQVRYKKGFPYLSGPKIFHYWSYILGEYCGVELSNSEFIEVAPDTHVIKCSVKLGVLSATEATTMSREAISARWRETLSGSELKPIDMHSPLWFWSRNDFAYSLTTPGSAIGSGKSR